MNATPTEQLACPFPDAKLECYVWVRRQWNDHRAAKVLLSAIHSVRYSDICGGVRARAPREFLHGYIRCDDLVEGDLAHSCRHGPPPHSIRVCIVKKDNDKAVIAELDRQARLRAHKTTSQHP